MFKSPEDRLSGRTVKVHSHSKLVWSKTDQCWSHCSKLPNGEWTHKSTLGPFKKYASTVDEAYRQDFFEKWKPLVILLGQYVANEVSLSALIEESERVGLKGARMKTIIAKAKTAQRPNLINTNSNGQELRP